MNPYTNAYLPHMPPPAARLLPGAMPPNGPAQWHQAAMAAQAAAAMAASARNHLLRGGAGPDLDPDHRIGSSMVLPPSRPRHGSLEVDGMADGGGPCGHNTRVGGVGGPYSPDSPHGSHDSQETMGTFRTDIGLDDKDLIDIETKDLNKRLKKANISKDRQKAIKAERRTLKNRGYASSCRIKREKEVERLESQIEDLRKQTYMYDEEVKELYKSSQDLKKWHKEMDECLANFNDNASTDCGYNTDSEQGTPQSIRIKDELDDE